MVARAFVLSTPNANNPAAVKEYGEGVKPLLEAEGATIAYRGPVVQTLTGAETPATVLIIEFADAGRACAFFDQDAYQALLPVRAKAFSAIQIHIAD